MIVNPMTRQVLNANPNGDNQYKNPDGKAQAGKFYKGRRFAVSSRLSKRIYEGPFDSEEEAAVHSYILDDLDNRRSNLHQGILKDKSGEGIPIAKGNYLQEDIDEANAGNLTEKSEGVDLPIRYRILRPRQVEKIKPDRINLMKQVLDDIRSRKS